MPYVQDPRGSASGSKALANNLKRGNESLHDQACAFAKESDQDKADRVSERKKLMESSRIFFAVTWKFK